MADLKKKTISGVIWGGIENFSTLFIQFVCNIIIARILSPSDFGLIGMLSIFIALGQIILDGGFGQALIRKQNATDIDYSSVFYVNLLLGFSFYGIFYSLSGAIADFFDASELKKIARIAFIVIPLNSIGLIQYTLLTKKMDFKVLSKVSITSAILSGILGIAIAFYYQNVWALVIQIVSFYLFRMALLWIIGKWWPKPVISLKSIRELFSFSMNLLLMNVIGVVFNNIYTLFIGKVYNPAELGYYSQADRIQKVPSSSLTNVIQRVSFPVFSTIQNDNERLKINHRKIMKMSCFIIFPIMFFLIVTAKDLFDLLLTEKWRPAVIYFQLLCITGALYPAQSISLNLLSVKGNGRIILSTEILRKIILIVILIITIRFNMIVLMYGQVLFSVIALLIAFYYGGREIGLKVYTQIVDMIPVFICSMLMMVLVYVTGMLLSDFSIWLRLTVQSLCAFSSYYLICKIMKLSSFQEALIIIKDFRSRLITLNSDSLVK